MDRMPGAAQAINGLTERFPSMDATPAAASRGSGQVTNFRPSDQGNRFRAGRMEHVRRLVADLLSRQGSCSIIDVGGLPSYWLAFGPDIARDPRVSITLVNISYDDAARTSLDDADRARFSFEVGDARCLSAVADKSFDLAHSNSVIEHVGRWADMRSMADEMRRVARLHFVQTPYWGFPIEPHNRTPLFHWLPEQVRYRMVLRSSLGFWTRARSVDEAMSRVQSSALLDRRQFGALFPASSIYSEVVFGLTKSLVAVGGDGRAVEPASNTRRLRI